MKPPSPKEEEMPQAPPAGRPEDLDPALTLKGAGGLPGVEKLGPWVSDTRNFLTEVNAEFKKISWPTRQQIVTETGVVILVCAFLTVMVMAYDWLFSLLANSVFYGQ